VAEAGADRPRVGAARASRCGQERARHPLDLGQRLDVRQRHPAQRLRGDRAGIPGQLLAGRLLPHDQEPHRGRDERESARTTTRWTMRQPGQAPAGDLARAGPDRAARDAGARSRSSSVLRCPAPRQARRTLGEDSTLRETTRARPRSTRLRARSASCSTADRCRRDHLRWLYLHIPVVLALLGVHAMRSFTRSAGSMTLQGARRQAGSAAR
jgi:hypothetical protein